MEVQRALADLAEVRDRLATCQRFRGYSGTAAAVSGGFAVLTALAQLAFIPHPAGAAQAALYLQMWLACLATALALNYGAIALWYVRDPGSRARSQINTAGLTILPALALGAVLSTALIFHQLVWLLPGVWHVCYGLGLFASRTMLPEGLVPVAIAFALMGSLLLFAGPGLALAWWVMIPGFGLGQASIGWLVLRERKA